MGSKKSKIRSILQIIFIKHFVLKLFLLIILNIVIIIMITSLESPTNLKMKINNLTQEKERLIVEGNYSDKEKDIKEKINFLDNINEEIKTIRHQYLSNVGKLDNLIAKGAIDAKIAYLTFDDGPTDLTDKFLDVLETYKVLGTFFVLGRPSYLKQYQRIINDGHEIGNHTYSHNFNYLYYNNGLIKDINKLNDFLYDNFKIKPSFIRLPGGSSTVSVWGLLPQVKKQLFDNNIGYVDWNVSSGDGGGVKETIKETIDYVINGSKNKKISVILMHDYNQNTLNALPHIIEKLQEMNYEILPLVKESSMIKYK